MSELAAPSRRPLPAPIGIMVAPRRTMRSILDRHKRRGLIALPIAAFFSTLIGQTDWRQLGRAVAEQGSLFVVGVLAAGILFAALVAMALYLLFALAATLAGRFLGGDGAFHDVRAAVAWGAAPFVWALLYRIPAAIFWSDAYRALHGNNEPRLQVGAAGLDLTFTTVSAAPLWQVLILGAIDLVLIAVYLFVGSSTLAEAHGVSSWHGLGTLLLMIAMPIVALLVVVLAVLAAGN